MRLWRLAGADYAARLDGGYGIANDGRWNSRGRPVTYCSTGPALCVLEKLVHIGNVDLIPDDTVLVRYEVAEGIAIEDVRIEDLPAGWCLDEGASRAIGDNWLDRASSCLLRVPSVILPIAGADDRNVVINHRHADAAAIEIAGTEPFAYDPRLFRFG